MARHDRSEARTRAEGQRNLAMSHEQTVKDMRAYAETLPDGPERRAALGHVAIQERHVSHALAIAEAYDRVARGEEPFMGASGSLFGHGA